MRGAPWNGLFYGFVLEVVIGFGAFVYAMNAQDFLARTVAWLVFALAVVGTVRSVRAAIRLPDSPDRPTGRWWFGG